MIGASESWAGPLPDFLVIGAAKSGTTSLFFYLAQNPALFLPISFKEPGFFCFAERPLASDNPAKPYPDMWKAVIADLAQYSALFTAAEPGQLLGEATPEYLYLYDPTIATIRRIYGNRARDLKFVAILREPVARIWSHYWMFRRDGYETLDFARAASAETIRARLSAGWHPSYDYRGFGQYASQLRAWQDAFGSERIKVILLDDLQSDPARTCDEIFQFLAVSPFRPKTSTQYNASGALKNEWLHEWLFRRQYGLKSLGRKIIPSSWLQSAKQRLLTWNSTKVPMPTEAKDYFSSFYRSDVLALQELLGRDLSSWLR